MDYYLDILCDPIELVKNEETKFPDRYRPHRFNIPNFVESTNLDEMAEKTSISLCIWQMTSIELSEYLASEVSKFFEQPEHTSAEFITNKDTEPVLRASLQRREVLTQRLGASLQHREVLQNYYKKIYDIADVASTDKDKLLKAILKLLNFDFPSRNIPHIRMCIYLSVHLIRRSYDPLCLEKCSHNILTNYFDTIRAKIKEFQEFKDIGKYFLNNELDDYVVYVNKIKDGYSGLKNLQIK